MENSRNRVLHRNESTKRELLNRPRLLTIINRLKTDFSSYKFTVYRCATKLHALQKALHSKFDCWVEIEKCNNCYIIFSFRNSIQIGSERARTTPPKSIG